MDVINVGSPSPQSSNPSPVRAEGGRREPEAREMAAPQPLSSVPVSAPAPPLPLPPSVSALAFMAQSMPPQMSQVQGSQATVSQQQQQQQQDFDPVQKYRMLIPQLKESLQNLMKVAEENLMQNMNIDNGQKSADGVVQRFDKSLEEFYALCDQLELCLRLAYECLSQSFDSTKHSPTLVPTATKPDAVQAESLPYTQYLSMIKSQISCAKDIHNALLECSKKITGKAPPNQGGL
ncbi:mediator of RNA polymerase II transcription subunit 29 [Microcaecilia unicolor]|uniref:Mediator of RNA polymerase II transcription subunit 29 n=1 Tax=Microcaecilia unicolor TaxID=1415580 RepID=A0A6P7Z7R4_9AMPH|nr:mediator of RNA polymerase II transcription subunit 29-like [Microcaecilia unicolor]